MRILETILGIVLLPLFIFVSCNTKNASTEQSPRPKSIPITLEQGIFTKGVLYKTGCVTESIEVAGMKTQSFRRTYVEEDNHFTRTKSYYVTEQGCQDEVISVIEKGTLTENGSKRELFFEETLVTPKNDLVSAALNEASACGFSNWETNSPQQITSESTNCFENSTPRSEVKNLEMVGQTLFISDGSNGSEKRFGYRK